MDRHCCDEAMIDDLNAGTPTGVEVVKARLAAILETAAEDIVGRIKPASAAVLPNSLASCDIG